MRPTKPGPGLVVVALCLGGALTACGGGGDGEGYAAVGAGPSPKGAATPSGAVTLIPLDGPTAGETTSSTSSPSPVPPASSSTGTPAPPPTDTVTAPGVGPTSPPDRPGAGSDGTAPVTGGSTPSRTPSTTPGPRPGTGGPAPSPTSTPPPAPAPTPAPALLTVSAPVLADGDRRWCERVTVTFRNSGGTAARSGTVTFATHVIGALGVDWATLTSSRPLPAPIAAGAARTETYTVCVDSWRVPLGMRIDTRQVTATWQ
ncbi:hypothetical protein [Streptomyces exfoliatus]|uniref:hypothetical protein n=1 Tax=Streptomyces exfoliatus TaxID=1905 RepID=UPI001FE1D733|nr:hypothetical protein [Streptomyces exfoliatus]